MAKQSSRLLAPALLAALATPAFAQAPAAANVIQNGGFERLAAPQENLWDGVNSDGVLAGFRRSLEVLTERASAGALAMPMAVQWADFNGDGKPDLLVVDPVGYFRVYFNSGTKEQPKFTHNEIIPIYLSRTDRGDNFWKRDDPPDRRAPRVAAADWGRAGKIDLVVGNMLGEVYFIPNAGTSQQPVYRQPDPLARGLLQTSRDGRLWGNLLSPAAADWNKDGRLDLLLGEGTYSANAIHLLENQSATGTPQFAAEKRWFLAYGDGREHLIPTVADLNGDGHPDLIASDRSGQVGVYFSPAAQWKPGVEVPFASYLSFGNSPKPGGQIAPCAADFNGDGLIDLLLGRDNGRVSVALNKGTATEPKFESPTDLTGEDVLGKSLRPPSGWEVDDGRQDGNAFITVSVVTAQEDPKAEPPEGAACLKVFYSNLAQQVFPFPAAGIPGTRRTVEMFREVTVNANSRYEFSFKTKGGGAADCSYALAWKVDHSKAPMKMERGERGSVTKTFDNVRDEQYDRTKFSPGGAWSTVSKTFSTKLNKPGMDAVKTFNLRILLLVNVRQDGAVYLDDFQLTEKK